MTLVLTKPRFWAYPPPPGIPFFVNVYLTDGGETFGGIPMLTREGSEAVANAVPLRPNSRVRVTSLKITDIGP